MVGGSRAPQPRSRRAAVAVVSALLFGTILAGCGDTVGIGSLGRPRRQEALHRGLRQLPRACGCGHQRPDRAGSRSAFVESRIEGFNQATIRQVVRGQIAYPVVDPPTKAPGMPKDIFTGQRRRGRRAVRRLGRRSRSSGNPMDRANPPADAPPGRGDEGEAVCVGGLRRVSHPCRSRARGQSARNLDETKPSRSASSTATPTVTGACAPSPTRSAPSRSQR